MSSPFFQRHRRRLRQIGFLAVLGFVLLLYREKTVEILSNRPNFSALAVGLVVLVFECFVATWRWGILLRAGGVSADFKSVFEMTVYSRLAQVAVSVPSAGDLARVGIVAARFSDRVAGIGAIVLDRLVGLLGLLICAVVGGLVHYAKYNEPVVQRLTLMTIVMLCVSLLGCTLILSRGVRSNLHRLVPGAKLQRVVHKAADGLSVFNWNRQVFASCVLLAIVTHLLSIMAFYFASIGLHVNTQDVLLFFVIVPFVFLTSAIPIPLGAMVASLSVGELLFRSMGLEGGALYALAYRLLMVAATVVASLLVPILPSDSRGAEGTPIAQDSELQ